MQYRKSFGDLERYARDPHGQHLPAWRTFNRRVRDNRAVGIFHETYRWLRPMLETVYVNMPVFGLTEATAAVPVRGSQTAAARLGVRPLDVSRLNSRIPTTKEGALR